MASSRRTGTNENISTYGGAGLGRDYTVLATWEADTDVDLVGTSQSEVLECYSDEVFDDYIIAYTTTTVAITNSSYFRIIRPASGHEHNGVVGGGVRFNTTTPNVNGAFIAEDNFSIQDVEWSVNSTSTNGRSVIVGYGDEISFVGLIVSNSAMVTNSANPANGFNCFPNGFFDAIYIVNCLVTGLDATGTVDDVNGILISAGSGESVFVYNCTVTDIGNSTTGTVNGITSTDSSGDAYVSNTVVDDINGTAIGGVALTQVTNYTAGSVVFEDAASADYRLSNTDRACRVNGTDLTSDGDYPFNDDIRGYVRKPDSPWDIGAFENISSRRIGKNENVSTYGNGTRDYTSMATWEAATDNNLVSLQQSEALECYADSASFDDGIDVGGATTNSSYFRIVRAAAGQAHGGDASAGVIFSGDTYLANNAVFRSQSSESYFIVCDIVVKDINRTGYAVAVNMTASFNKVLNCIIHNLNGSSGSRGFQSYTTNASPRFNVNNIISDTTGGNSYGLSLGSAAGCKERVYNCLVIDVGTGSVNDAIYIYSLSGDTFLKNLILDGNTDNFGSGTTGTKTTCYVGPENGPGSYTADLLVDPANQDWAIDSSDTNAKGQGTDLTQDLVFPFDDDIAGNSRGGAAWDIGPFAYIAPEGGGVFVPPFVFSPVSHFV